MTMRTAGRSTIQVLETSEKENILFKGKDTAGSRKKSTGVRAPLKQVNEAAHAESVGPVKTFGKDTRTPQRRALSNITNKQGNVESKAPTKASIKITTPQTKTKTKVVETKDIEPCFTTKGKSTNLPYVLSDADLDIPLSLPYNSAFVGTSTTGRTLPPIEDDYLSALDASIENLIVDDDVYFDDLSVDADLSVTLKSVDLMLPFSDYSTLTL